MTVIEEKVSEIKDFVNAEELERIKMKMDKPERVICPFNRRYWLLPLECTGYHYVCPHLERVSIVCEHPEKREWKVSYVGPDVRVLTR
jgi:hypothetical protein